MVDSGASVARGTTPFLSRFRPLWRVVEIAPALVITNSLLAILYRPWGDRLRTPFSYQGDGLYLGSLVQAMNHGWDYANNPLVGAPYGATNYDFPVGGDRLHLVILELMSRFVSNPFVVINMYFLLAFSLITITAYASLRLLRFGVVLSTLGSVLFTFTPYHFSHGVGHLFLSGYFAVPPIIYLLTWSSSGAPPFELTRRPLQTLRSAMHGRSFWILVVCCLLAGSASSYYAVFGILLLAAVGVTLSVRTSSWHTLVKPVLAAFGILLFAFLALLPEFVWQLRHGDNPAVAERSAAESESWGLHLAQMATPEPTHHVNWFANLGLTARSGSSPGELGTYLGVAALAGLVFIAVQTIRGRHAATEQIVHERRRAMALGASWALLIGTVGGFSMLLAVVGFTQLRVWGRISIVLLFMGLVGCLDLLDTVRKRLEPRALVGLAAVSAVLAVGLFDQMPENPRFDLKANATQRAEDRAFAETLAGALDQDAMVFQLPVMSYPENGPVVSMADYDHFRMPLAADGSLRWSYGGIRGRDADWQATLARGEPELMFVGLAAARFDALYIDRFGYEDGAESIEQEALRMLGQPVAQSRSGRLVWYDLRPLHAEVVRLLGATTADDLGSAVTRPIALWDLSDRPYDGRFESGDSIAVRNEGASSVVVSLSFASRTPDGGPVTLETEAGDMFTSSPADGLTSVRLDVPSGQLSIRLTTESSGLGGGDPRDDLALDGLAISDVTLTSILESQAFDSMMSNLAA